MEKKVNADLQQLNKYDLEARKELEKFFSERENQEKVFYSRQLEVMFEDTFFHWVTNRAIRDLIEMKKLKKEIVELKTASKAHIIWHPSFRYYKRAEKSLVSLIEEYSHPNLSADIGIRGEQLILEGFAVNKFLLEGREVNEFEGRQWTESNHDLDFIFSKDNISYGVEVKNMLGYMDYEELEIKLKMCEYLSLKPIIVARMLPKSWISEIHNMGGFALILKYQLYPISFKELAKRINKELGLPVDAPKKLKDGTMVRVVNWHKNNVNLESKSH